jgi:hypothetical protein
MRKQSDYGGFKMFTDLWSCLGDKYEVGLNPWHQVVKIPFAPDIKFIIGGLI